MIPPDDALIDPSPVLRGSATHSKPLEPIDLNELEKAAASAARALREPSGAPPRPSSRPASIRPPSLRPAPPRPSRPPGPQSGPPSAKLSRPPPGKYAATRPASIFATSKPPSASSLFGEDLISERSLDEVILSFLAEDLDGDAK